MSAAQLPTAEHRFTALPPASPSLRAEALRLYGSRTPGAPVRPAHLAAKATLTAITAEAHSEMRAETPCPLPPGECWVCDRQPGRHVADEVPTCRSCGDPILASDVLVSEPDGPVHGECRGLAFERAVAESRAAELNGEWAREGGDY